MSYEDKKYIVLLAIGLLMIGISLWPENSIPIQELKPQPLGESYQQAQPQKLEQALDIIRQDDHSAEICINNQVYILIRAEAGTVFGPLRGNDFKLTTCKQERTQ